MSLALVRGVPSSFARALAAVPVAIDVERARAQHADYVAGLRALGLEILELPADDEAPDCCFVEDVCVVAGGRALLTVPGAPSRRREVEPVARALDRRCALARMAAPATLDGGDCLRLGDRFYVGVSARTNDAGRAALAAAFGLEVVPVPLPPGTLHLKSVCSALADDLVLVAAGTIAPAVFAGARVVVAPEAIAANAVAHGGAALVAAGCPETRARVEAAGFRTVTVDTSELRKADGALTCLSVVML
jgi:dimethylargininase